MNNDKKESFELATKSLQKGISKLCKKRPVDRRTEKGMESLVKHIHHLLLELCRKRASLKSLIRWFESEWNSRLVKRLGQNKSTVAILQHTLEVFVRCQDGLVLLTSGECRHAGDTQRAKKTKFPSKLSSVEERQDGYTCLYKSDAVYSGFGFDEYANETVGIQARLMKYLKQTRLKAPWDWLESHSHTQLLDSLLDEHERDIKDMQQELQTLKRKVTRDIKHCLSPTTLTFVTQDKMERLAVTYGKHTIRLERRADSFQLEGSSVLPSERQSPKDWASYALQFQDKPTAAAPATTNGNPTNKGTKRRRLTIVDSDEDDDHNNKNSRKKADQAKKPKSTGLLVKVHNITPTEETEHSVAAIKTQMGINASRLETARETLELETKQRQEQEQHVERLKKVLTRAQNRDFVDDNEVWDARECLRQAYMEIGNEYLWTTKEYRKALECFQEAKRLVNEQQCAHKATTATFNDHDTLESRFLHRNLLFLKARAAVNLGIVLVEWSSAENLRKKATQAISEFRSATSISEELRRQAMSDQRLCPEESSNWMETMSDIVKANQIESLACRWMGIAMWSSNKQDQAMDMLLKACKKWQMVNVRVDDQLLQEVLEGAAECIYATTTLTDLVCSAMERLVRSNTEKGDALLSVVTQSLERHAELSSELEKMARDASYGNSVRYFVQEEKIAPSKQILSQLTDISNWWEQVKNQPARFGTTTTGIHNNSTRPLPRSDVFPLGVSVPSTTEPVVRILATEKPRQRRKDPKTANKNTNRSSTSRIMRTSPTEQLSSILDQNDAQFQQPKVFRKWGDDLLPSKAPLPYPSVAPEMPAEIRELLNRAADQTAIGA